MARPIYELFPDLMVFMEGAWEDAPPRSRVLSVASVFEDVFKFDLGLCWRVGSLTEQQSHDYMVWSLRHGRVHDALLPHLDRLEGPSGLENWRESEWRANPATPIELVFPELMDGQPPGATWAGLSVQTRITRLRLLALDLWGRRHRLNDRPRGLTPEQELAALEDGIRRDEAPDGLMSAALYRGRIDEVDWS